jgi:hypothetical protein
MYIFFRDLASTGLRQSGSNWCRGKLSFADGHDAIGLERKAQTAVNSLAY